MPVHELESNVDSLVLQVELGAPPAAVFEYLIDPELLAQWWPPEAVVDPRPGGNYVMSWPSQGWHLRGEFTDFDPAKRLAFSWHWDHEPALPTRLVSIHLEPDGPSTVLRLIHGVYGPDSVEQADRESHRAGWLYFLDRLEQAVALRS